ncbi:sperm-associated antigen 8 [Sarcophilus harrisii]|uniref:Sperm associated antigen 8 n=1 Tax=Sarcophilus harrisii TaxID=9305 RepID=A0A7N4PMA7_SARHA|nr:sperm-associated antigen 8 [Sarcophilus harrisii]
MPGKTYCCEVIGGAIPKGVRARGRGRSLSPRKGSSLTTSTAWDTSTDETLPFLGGEHLVDSQQSSGTLYGTDSSLDTCCVPVLTPLCFLLQPPPPPPKPCIKLPVYRPPKVQEQEAWKSLQIPEPGVPGPAGYPEYIKPPERLPRGQCLIHNWVEERATNELDRVLGDEINEGFCFRHGHLGLLTLELCSPQASKTTHKDSFQDPGNPRKALRGRREAMLELFLHDQIWKGVNQESSPPECFNYESVTHHDYKRKQHPSRPPPPTKPRNLQQQPEPYCVQEIQDFGLSPICGHDVIPFGRNCSFLTSVPLCMDQPLPCSTEQPLPCNPEDCP